MRAYPIQGATLPILGNLAFGAQRKRADGSPHIHRGVDLPRQEGTAVFAVADGTVEHAADQWEQGFSGYGGHVVIRHPNDVRTLYAHLSSVLVKPGEHVLAGDRIGAVGRTAFTREDPHALLESGPHLHFEVSPRKYPQPSESARLDPVEWLGAGVDPRVAAALGAAARTTGVDLLLLRALSFVASAWNPAASGPRVGAPSSSSSARGPGWDGTALGLLGLTPDQLRMFGVTEVFSPVENALAGAKLLRTLLSRYGSTATALAAYVWGTPNVDRKPSSHDWPAAIEQWVSRVLERYAVEQAEGTTPPLVQRRAGDGARS